MDEDQSLMQFSRLRVQVASMEEICNHSEEEEQSF